MVLTDVGLFGCSPWQTLMNVLLRAVTVLPLTASRTDLHRLNCRVTLLGARFSVPSRIAIGRPCPWLTPMPMTLPPLTLNLTYELWSGTTPVEKTLPLSVPLTAPLKQIFGECMSRDIMICLALPMTNAFPPATSGKLFTNIARDPTLLALEPKNLVAMNSGREQARLPLWYRVLAHPGLLKWRLWNDSDTRLSKLLTGSTLLKTLLRLEAVGTLAWLVLTVLRM